MKSGEAHTVAPLRLRSFAGWAILMFLALMQVNDIASRHIWGGDLLVTAWRPALAVIHGTTPYPPSDPTGSVYPPPIFLLSVPLTVLPWPVAVALYQVAFLAAAVLTLRVLRVRDWRCYLLWLLSAPFVVAFAYGNVTILIVLLAALVWRYRDNQWVAAAALAAAVTIKLLLAPLALWLLFRGRWRATVWSAAFAAVAILAGWAVISFDGFLGYPLRLNADARIDGPHGALVQALARQAGMSQNAALLVGAAVALACFVAAWRTRDELTSFALVLLGTLVLSPLGWIYYLGLLIVPLAVRHPRFDRAWVAFGFLWVGWSLSPFHWYSVETSVLVLAICALIVARLVGQGGRDVTAHVDTPAQPDERPAKAPASTARA